MPNADYEYKVNGGKVTLTRYLCKEELVTVPEGIDGYPVTTLDSTFLYKSTSKKSRISPTLFIYHFAFSTVLSEVRALITKSTTSIRTIEVPSTTNTFCTKPEIR